MENQTEQFEALNKDSFSYSGTELDAMVEARKYRLWILSHFKPFLGKYVLEVGAGNGAFSQLLLEEPGIEELLLLEPAVNLLPLLRRQFSGIPRVRVASGFLSADTCDSFPVETVIMINVLEHVENDREYLQMIQRMLPPDGRLLLFVPAVPAIFGSLDRAFDHYRRYTKADLSEKLSAAGFQIEKTRHFNLPGVAAWFAAGRLLNKKTIRPNEIRFYDRWVVPVISKLEHHWEPSVGQSLVVIAKIPSKSIHRYG